MRYNTLLFDLDDTLWDTAGNSRESLIDIFSDYCFDEYYTSFDEFHACFSKYNLMLWDKYGRHEITKEALMGDRFYTPFRHFDKITPNKAVEINAEFMKRTSEKIKTIDGAIELLNELKPHFKMHILSNGFEEVQYTKIENSGLKPYFDKIVLSDHIGINKPNPALFQHALKESGAIASSTMMIGDNWLADVVGAKNSGIDQIWFNPNQEKIKDPEFEASHTIQKLEEIKTILLG